ncbi:phage major capsid protein [Nitrosomonas ureae]|uniref:Phage major capsid protein, HK97 family n=1 Tax=Nitrosomonas ureae TaxID=44577 RepID=A0A1H9C9X4_9PROT|nr:phage major capsid protein [Nitrosomonas ureae]SEP97954.1 phage major capsid protein, HK97 family [Nitrosomonas ureae]
MNQQMEKPKSNGGAVEIVMNAFSEFKSKHDENLNKRDQQLKNDIAEVQSSFDRVEEILNRPSSGIPQASALKPDRFAVDVSGKRIPVLGRDEQLQNHFRPQPSYGEPEFSLEDFVKNSMGISSRNNSVLERGSATVPEFLTSRIIDDIRAKNTLIKSGALTLPLDGKTVIGRIDTDPVAYLHAEGIDDIDLSLPVFSPIELDPGMIAVQIPLSVEIVADSANLDLLLRTSIAAAVAKKLDTLGITALLADANIPDSATGEDTETWSGLITAAGSHIALNGDWPKAVISNAGDYTKRISQLAGDGHWVSKPPELLPLSDLFTTSMTAGKSIMGDFEKGLLLGMRQELRLEVVRWHQPGSASHLLVAYLRGQFYVVQPAAMYRQLKTVV